MEQSSIKKLTIFEHQFWLQILGDHARFILNGLSPNETTFIKKADMFISKFDNLLDLSKQKLSNDELDELNTEIYKVALKFREFKLDIINKQLTDKIDISLSSTFINHMVNELDDYILILTALIKESYSHANPIHLHLLWLSDGAGHASIIASNLDITQKQLIKIMRMYSKNFDNMYLKAIEYKGYMRGGLTDFPALNKLNLDVDEIMNSFKEILKELRENVLNKKVLSILPPLSYDHMFREECYYLTKLSFVANINKPNCNPAKERIE
ncbi:protein of unknown function [Clostridium cavendishii DSM 21758]|uniref:DUF2935 domain-containing protein n=1 Tax=Clostridium cavendishii DSM 21758 TaxID=1121302 RepID=A0A1M6N8A3_9CLOT|nr:DUF2935 domain-containing protein [Clostridium cavendishii]SHJ91949.1 protein of unknown function [Clostridium cavendishii DSM 21758]